MSPTQEAAMRQALEALEMAYAGADVITVHGKAITALKAALAERQEPMVFVDAAHLQGLMLGLYGYAEIYADDSVGRIPLYTSTPPKHTPLSENEIFKIENDIPDDVVSDRAWTIWFARAVERAHGIS